MVKSYSPTSLAEALQIRASQNVVPIAGGTDLMIGNVNNTACLFIGKLPELKAITEDDEYVYIGACVTFAEALRSPLTPPLTKEAISKIASPAIRNVGTFGGNICNGAGKADSVVSDFVYSAKVRLESVNGVRIMDASDFSLGRKKVALKDNELMTAIMFPKSKIAYDYYFEKVSTRNALAISNVSFGAIWQIEEGIVKDIAIAIGAAGDTVLRCVDIEEKMKGKTIKEVEEERLALIKMYNERMYFPLDRTSQNYRVQVCSNLIGHILSEYC